MPKARVWVQLMGTVGLCKEVWALQLTHLLFLGLENRTKHPSKKPILFNTTLQKGVE